MAITAAAAGVANSNTSNATLAITTTTAMAVGDYSVVQVGADNNGTSGATSTASVIDSAGNTYTLRGDQLRDPGAAAAGVSVRVYVAPITSALASGQTITVNFSPNTQAKTAVAWKVMPTSGSTLSFVTETGTTNNTANPTHTTGSITSGNIVLACMGMESNVAITADSDTTNGNWSTAQTTLSAGSMSISAQYKVVTGTATQTYNVTVAANDWAISAVVLTEALTVPAAPTDLAGTAGSSQVALTWTAPPTVSPALSDYAIQYQAEALVDSDDFTGTNGAAWDASWSSTVTTQGNGGTGTATIEGNHGRITSAGTGNFTRTFKKLATAPSHADQMIVGDLVITSTAESYPIVVIRGTDPATNGNGYAIQWDVAVGHAAFCIYTGYVATAIGSNMAVGAMSIGDVFHFKLRAIGSAISAKCWKNAGAEPAWQTVTNATYTTAGNIVIGGAEGNAASVTTWEFDNVAAYTLDAAFTTWNPTTSTTASETVTGLTNGTAYGFKVAGINSNGTGPYSDVEGPYIPTGAGATNAPAVVANATATAFNATALVAPSAGFALAIHRPDGIDPTISSDGSWILSSDGEVIGSFDPTAFHRASIKPTAGAASATATALTTGARAPATVATATGTASSASASIAANDVGDIIRDEAGNPILDEDGNALYDALGARARATAFNATATTGTATNAPAVVANVTATASNASTAVAPSAGAASATATANNPSPTVAPSAGQATATATANTATTSVSPTAGVATAAATAANASTSVVPNAGSAAATATAQSPSPSVRPTAGAAAATATASSATTTVAPTATGATATATAFDATATSGTFTNAPADPANATATAANPSASIAPTAGVAAATATASSASATVQPTAGVATATATAQTAATSVKPNASAAAATAAASNPSASVAPTAGSGAATATAFDGTVTVSSGSTNAPAGVASATATAFNASVSVNTGAGQASATATASAPKSSVVPTAGVASATATARDPFVPPQARIAQATALAFNATVSTAGSYYRFAITGTRQSVRLSELEMRRQGISRRGSAASHTVTATFSVYKIGGVYTLSTGLTAAQMATATEVFLGGHEYTVDTTTAAALTSAGYGAYLTPA